MEYFLDTVETIPSGQGFSQFGGLHLMWLGLSVIVILLNCLAYRNFSDKGRARWRKIIATLIVLDEVFKMLMLILGDRYTASYLPFHSCSINIFIIAFHAQKPTKSVSSFLYTVCIPGAVAALLFPSWSALPFVNFMHLHSFSIHILLAMYPLVLAVNGDIKIEVSSIPKCLALLLGMAIPIYIVNMFLGTNFMFLMSAEEGNPLYLFEQLWGNHLLGYPVIIIGILVLMYVPVLIARKIRLKKNPPA